MASGEKTYLADKETLDLVNQKTGVTTDTGGSSTAGTVMGKLNGVITLIGQIGEVLDSI